VQNNNPASPYRLDNVNWVTTIALLVLHIGAIASFFYFDWKSVIVAAVLYWTCVGWGIGMGYHRLLTHRSYRVPKPLEYFFAICGTLTLEGGPIFWVATHRLHHQRSDQPGDPHSPKDGPWWAHVGWIIFGESKHNATEMMSKYAPDLGRDPFYRCSASAACRCSSGAFAPASCWGCTPPGWSIPPRTSGASAGSARATTAATTGGWRC
jgi:stearoyl-CoA desaturase (delta-9 desaturase)